MIRLFCETWKNTFLKFYWILFFPNSYKTHKYRYGRSIEDEEIIDEHEALSNAILDASLNDAEDCAKKLICSLNAKEVSTLASDEAAIAELFGKSGSIDVSGIVLRFFYLTFKIKIEIVSALICLKQIIY